VFNYSENLSGQINIQEQIMTRNVFQNEFEREACHGQTLVKQAETWSEFSTLEVTVCVPSIYYEACHYSLT